MKLNLKILNLISLGCFLICSCSDISSSESTSSQPSSTSSTSEDQRIYDEESDSTEGIDVNDLSGLYSSFENISSYKCQINSYFNDVGLDDYYRHYQHKYIQDSICLFDLEKTYSYSLKEEYFDLNQGYLNRNNNYYSYFKRGSSVIERLANDILESDLTLVKENAKYQDDLLSLFKLNSEYLSSLPFTRISKNKYALTNKDYLYQFIDICAPNLINEGYYLTFSKLTIENNLDNMNFRLRLYASKTQSGKLINDNLDEANKPNWYLLFSEASIFLS